MASLMPGTIVRRSSQDPLRGSASGEPNSARDSV